VCTGKYSPRRSHRWRVPVCRIRAVGGVSCRGGRGNLVRESVRLVMQELIETEASERIGADRYERTETRITDRNGSRPRLLATQAGDVQLRIPKLRKGSFFPVILEPRRRIDQALYAVVMEAYVNGVSTRAVVAARSPSTQSFNSARSAVLAPTSPTLSAWTVGCMRSWVVSTPAHRPKLEGRLDVLVLASQGGSDQLTKASRGHTRHAGPKDRILRHRGIAHPRRMPFRLDRPSTEGRLQSR
jgi:hypothetical protein